MTAWLVLLASLAAGDAAPSAYSDEAADAFFAEFAQKRDGIRVLEARFVQDDIVPEETVRSLGTLVFARPRRIVFRYEGDDEGFVQLVDGHKAYEYRAEFEQLEIRNLQESPLLELFFLGFDDDTAALRKAYEVSVFEVTPGPEVGAATRKVVVRPKALEGEPPPFRELQLFLRDEDYLPIRIHIVNDEESQVSIGVSGFVKNAERTLAKTRIALPEGTKVIEDDEVVRTVGPEGAWAPAGLPVREPAPKEKDAP
ncbi:MAG: hypothetical protein GWP08_05010 [Nitrospiraceae bacterium]|nr:hypothetical protein [Nitrospiraceae bacterium]